MPRLPGEIYRRIEEKTEQKKIGEEGTLHKITLNNESYFAKKWRSRHYRESHKTGPGYSETSEWKTSVSPFWHKVISYESRLISDALPDLVVRIETSYDPRMKKDGSSFDFKAGRPVTLAKNVKGNPELRAKRDAMMDPVYDLTWEQRIHDDRGVYVGAKDGYNELMLWVTHDTEMIDSFGEHLDIRRFIHSDLYSREKNGYGL
ncbi:MAG: hypothetical protein UT30_C0003G0054 [Candidatus Uhrbacteria bacterium GW2011_GWF2_39_13]|uniref:Uncharacterized protein n=1 Tax=Candidatus Uhrbacteria bacterium GW2011_GWF2_39_13 TaxID=1618995 RepID=A0A0G0Q372_9BACT|nr:MAG: hypothetical protein UT30_C0003G0054 [Candidatus Uhrbacteria bacterium GW2011_GWF2_39_13]HAU66229.1 hypothetical protein [Candidatus Uhrbacteria bacterium]